MLLKPRRGKCACTALVPAAFFIPEVQGMGKHVDLTGQKFGRLTVIKRAKNRTRPSGGTVVRWACQCDCGRIVVVDSYALRSGHTQSCGCRKIDILLTHSKKHGLSGSFGYRTWDTMIQRCTNPNHKHFLSYGGRGITVCDKWRNSFQSFFDDISKLPHFGEYGYTLDRINVNGNYEPDNVRWATKKEQQNNMRSNRLITYNDETKTISQWAEELGFNTNTLYARIVTYGWNIERAMTEPVQKHGG